MNDALNIKDAIHSQYHAALSMLEQSIANCPEHLWYDDKPVNKYWQVAFHALFYTHLYLQPSESVFTRWPKHREASQSLGKPESVEPYTQAEILEYLAFCREQVDQQVAVLDVAADSGFDWLPFNKLELQFYNMRHIMEHTGELSGRLFEHEGIEINWVGKQR
ncbi:MAG: hypothetical protein IAF02_16820 [Anaerolineae bacterium]|nr:hypothetical protein [Anaerolineae bacterium]